MAAFGAEQRHLFFGRDIELVELATRVRHQPFLVMLGPSGCGKSSLAVAGLVPLLSGADETPWLARVMQPGAAPYDALCQSLAAPAGSEPNQLPALVDDLLARHRGAERVLLIVDQAEAVFTQAPAAEREAFLAAVSALRTGPRSCLLLLLRADFFGELMTSRLWPLGAPERFELATLARPGLRQAIVRPAAAMGVHVEPVLLERLLHDCAQEPGALPLLQETMVLLWRRRARRLLTLAAYEDIAGSHGSILSKALVLHADAALGSLSTGDQVIAERVLLRMVQLGEGRAHTRRQQPLSTLRRSGADPKAVDRVIQHLAQRRILTLGRPAEGAEAEANLAHESLIVRWPVMQCWIDEHRADELRRRRLEHDAQQWAEADRDRDALYRGHRLADARRWAHRHPGELTDTALGFLAAGRRRRALRVTASTTLAAVGLVALMSLGDTWLDDYNRKQDLQELRSDAQDLGDQVVVAGGWLRAWGGAASAYIPAMEVDVHEVTNAQYELCVEAERCDAPAAVPGRLYSRGTADLPVVGVTAVDARRYCLWVDSRLPTAREWLWIAIGSSDGPYPWGDENPQSWHVNLENYLIPVSSTGFEQGETAEGIGHLVGNAAEWTSTVGDYDRNLRVVIGRPWNGLEGAALILMGGQYGLEPDPPVRSATLAKAHTDMETTGFRCVGEQ
jgi:hypothetical protein